MTKSQRLISVLRDQMGCNIPESATLDRIYSSPAQRAAGAWSWIISVSHDISYGSQYSVSQLLAADSLVITEEHHSNYSIDPGHTPSGELVAGAVRLK